MDIRAPRRGTLLTTCPLTKSAFGSPTRPVLELRFEETQNLVSTNVPVVIESHRASCNGIGMFIELKREQFASGRSVSEVEELYAI